MVTYLIFDEIENHQRENGDPVAALGLRSEASGIPPRRPVAPNLTSAVVLVEANDGGERSSTLDRPPRIQFGSSNSTT